MRHANHLISRPRSATQVSISNLTLEVISSSVSQEGVLSFSWTPRYGSGQPISFDNNIPFNLLIYIYSGYTNATSSTSTWPGGNFFDDATPPAGISGAEAGSGRASLHNLVSASPATTIPPLWEDNVYRPSVAPGNPYVASTANRSQVYGPVGHAGIGVYPIVNLFATKSLTNAYTSTVDLKEYNNRTEVSSRERWKNGSKLCAGNTLVVIKPYHKSNHVARLDLSNPEVGAWAPMFWETGNWSSFTVNIPSTADFPAKLSPGVATNFSISGRTVRYTVPGGPVYHWIDLYKNGSSVFNNYANDGNPSNDYGAGEAAYTVPANFGSGNFTYYISFYDTQSQSWGSWSSGYSFSL